MLISKLKAKHDELANSKLPPAEVAKLLKKGALLVDVRTKLEARKGVAPGATHISLFTLKRRVDKLPRDRNIVLYCGTGGRAEMAKRFLESEGFKAFNGGGYEDVVKILGTIEKSKA